MVKVEKQTRDGRDLRILYTTEIIEPPMLDLMQNIFSDHIILHMHTKGRGWGHGNISEAEAEVRSWGHWNILWLSFQQSRAYSC